MCGGKKLFVLKKKIKKYATIKVIEYDVCGKNKYMLKNNKSRNAN